MLLKLATKKKSRKIQQSEREVEKVQKKGDALRLSWLPTGNAPTSTSTLASSSACTSRTRAVTKLRRVCAGLRGFGRQLEPL